MHFASAIAPLLLGLALAVPAPVPQPDSNGAVEARTFQPELCGPVCVLACHFDPVCTAACIAVCLGTVEEGTPITNATQVNGTWVFS
ncbi:hypothetical protein NA56DRAFT_756175 [Hyaloscypha hepaticicola]|uniref:Uncharacterized protein n=1 Tax=Hyaloscypha hepaticicola TaxID=2082293 RepID=A0A2J6PG00_9HELO|nr:hypothetical protein NA56DRAFT_756175 [Hyaloscypha hepaticicola]